MIIDIRISFAALVRRTKIAAPSVIEDIFKFSKKEGKCPVYKFLCVINGSLISSQALQHQR